MLIRNYLNTLINEKGIPSSTILEIEGDGVFGNHYIPLEVVIDFLCSLSPQQQEEVFYGMVMIDVFNGDVLSYFNHLAKGMVKIHFSNN